MRTFVTSCVVLAAFAACGAALDASAQQVQRVEIHVQAEEKCELGAFNHGRQIAPRNATVSGGGGVFTLPPTVVGETQALFLFAAPYQCNVASNVKAFSENNGLRAESVGGPAVARSIGYTIKELYVGRGGGGVTGPITIPPNAAAQRTLVADFNATPVTSVVEVILGNFQVVEGDILQGNVRYTDTITVEIAPTP